MDQETIAQRYRERTEHDMFGFETLEYLQFLDYDHAKPFIRDDIPENDWNHRPFSRDDVLKQMKDYMPFAIEKAEGERGISANRSIMHYVAWTWLAGDEKFSQEIEREFNFNYHSYGLPILKRIADHYGWAFQ